MAWKRARGAPSRSSQTPASNLLAPTTLYRPGRDQIWLEDEQSSMPLEIPMCLVPGVRVPVIGTSLHLLGAAGFRALYPLLRRRYRSILNLEFHAIDFIDASDLEEDRIVQHQPDLEIPWRRKRARYTSIFETVADDYAFLPLEAAVEAT